MAKNHYKGAFVSDCREFPDIYISQGSVEMCLRCGGILNECFIASLLLSLWAAVRCLVFLTRRYNYFCLKQAYKGKE